MVALPGDSDVWIRRFHPAPQSRVRLVCFPHAGGSASFYFPVSAALSPSVEVLAVQYPGRQDRRADKLIDKIWELADRIFEALQSWVDRPLAFFGHSMGAVVAFEVARRLEQKTNTTLIVLFASGRRAPSYHRNEGVHLRDDDGLVAELKRLNGTDTKLLGDEELLRMILPAVRSDYKAIETYLPPPGPGLNCPVTVFVGDSDPKTTIDEASAWRRHSIGIFDMRVFSGGHFYLVFHQEAIIEAISECLKLMCGQHGGDRPAEGALG